MAGTQNQPLEYEQVTYNAPDGAQFGKTSTDKISLWGATPVIKTATAVTNISTTAFISTAGIYGFSTSTEGLQVTNALSTIIVALKALGAIN
jgi:hypothetical protein